MPSKSFKYTSLLTTLSIASLQIHMALDVSGTTSALRIKTSQGKRESTRRLTTSGLTTVPNQYATDKEMELYHAQLDIGPGVLLSLTIQ